MIIILQMFNPITLEIFNNLFSTICEEMGVVMCNSSFSTNIKERKDFSCAFFDSSGEMVAQAEHLPVHLASMSMSVKAALASVQMSDGDTVILNDPFQGGTHLPDITIVTPFFYSGSKKPVFYVANRAHHSDVGGMSPGSMCNATEIYQEGVRIPPVKIARGNIINKEIMNIITSNVRTPKEREWDIIAQISSNSIGKQRLSELCEKYGKNEVVKYSRELQDYSARIMESVIKRIPDGEYSFSDCLDDDGVAETPVKIKVCVKIKGRSVCVDFSGSSRQVDGCVNAVYAVTVSSVFYVFRCLVDRDIPSNSGCMRSISITVPEGSVVNAKAPSAVSGGNVETSQRIVDVVFGALSKAIPKMVPAASSGTMNNIAIGGYDKLKERHFTYYETIGGGMGARPTFEGINAIHTHMTNTLNTPIETLEHDYPFRISQYKIRPQSGGTGRHRGGHGIIRNYEFFQAATVSILSDRTKHGPYGLRGGKKGQCGHITLISKSKEHKLPSKTSIKVNRGDIISIHTPGGGGYGRARRLCV